MLMRNSPHHILHLIFYLLKPLFFPSIKSHCFPTSENFHLFQSMKKTQLQRNNGNTSKRQQQLQRLQCAVQIYDWGLPASISRVASLHALNSNVSVLHQPHKPYAELWMGTHDSGPSFLKMTNNNDLCFTSLKSWILQNPHVLGSRVLDNWGCDLPFLFKVLSVGKALSIQAHPDKELARMLHKTRPDVYKDANHKPEMALAVTEFEALCGFIGLEELKDVLSGVPEVGELIGSANVQSILHFEVKNEAEEFKPLLRQVFTKLMSADKCVVAEVVCKVKDRLKSENQVRQLEDKEMLVLRLEKQFPGDVGVISAFFLHYVRLKPGEALYIDANEPHAYLSGECVECMATSDNVVRAGLTPKPLDVQTLCSMLSYKQGFPEILKGNVINPYTKRYTPPFHEFEVDHCILPHGESTIFSAIPGPSIFLAMAGEGTIKTQSSDEKIIEGDVFFAPADYELLLTATTELLHIYRAGVNRKFL